MKAIQETKQIRIGIPRDYNGTINYNTLPTENHYADGWRDIIEPSYNSENQRKGAIYFDAVNDVFTYAVNDITESELIEQKKNIAENERLLKIQEEQEKAIIDQFQNITDDEQALENQAIYPIWDNLADGYSFVVGKKYQSFDGLELKLFKVIQSHTKQADWNPVLVPALFSEIVISNGVEVWKQPIGGDGKYPYINPLTAKPYQVSHKDSLWENTHTGGLNVWEPGVFGWKKI
jgi:hypothetical protein